MMSTADVPAHFGSSTESLGSVPGEFRRTVRRRPLYGRKPINYIGIMPPASSMTDLLPVEASQDTTILVVAGHALVREGLCSVLRATPGLSVIAQANDMQTALRIAARCKPDVLLLDEPPSDSADRLAMSRLRRDFPATCMLCLARSSEQSLGGLLCVPSNAGVDELCSVLGSVLGGRCAGCLLKPKCVAPQIAVALSRRETQVAVCVARGMSSKQIAATLGIALRTVNTYRESLAKKVGASSGAVLTRFVLEAKLDTPVALA
jgi:DNA-binding NarL/FixJ family response regulator